MWERFTTIPTYRGLNSPNIPSCCQQLANRCKKDTTQTLRGVVFLVVKRVCVRQFTFRIFIWFLKRSENSFFLFAPSSSLPPPSHSSYLRGVRSESIYRFTVKPNISDSVTKITVPFKAVALPPSFVKAWLETERSAGFALSFGPGAECRRLLQLRSYSFGVTTVVAGSGAVWRLVSEELGDGGMATTGGKMERQRPVRTGQ